MSQETAQRIEQNIRQAKEIVEFDKALMRLAGNRDFQKVIQGGYFKDEAVRLVHLKADPAMQTLERQTAIVAQIDAIGGLVSYFRTVTFNASIAMKAIESDEFTLNDILQEELTRG